MLLNNLLKNFNFTIYIKLLFVATFITANNSFCMKKIQKSKPIKINQKAYSCNPENNVSPENNDFSDFIKNLRDTKESSWSLNNLHKTTQKTKSLASKKTTNDFNSIKLINSFDKSPSYSINSETDSEPKREIIKFKVPEYKATEHLINIYDEDDSDEEYDNKDSNKENIINLETKEANPTTIAFGNKSNNSQIILPIEKLIDDLDASDQDIAELLIKVQYLTIEDLCKLLTKDELYNLLNQDQIEKIKHIYTSFLTFKKTFKKDSTGYVIKFLTVENIASIEDLLSYDKEKKYEDNIIVKLLAKKGITKYMLLDFDIYRLREVLLSIKLKRNIPIKAAIDAMGPITELDEERSEFNKNFKNIMGKVQRDKQPIAKLKNTPESSYTESLYEENPDEDFCFKMDLPNSYTRY